MLRSSLLWASTNPFLARRMPSYGFVRRAVRRFMPGETPEDALREAARMGAGGVPTVVTWLGENVHSVAEARDVADGYRALAATVKERGLDVELSVKPTHLGLEHGVDVAVRHIEAIAEVARGIVWIDMEGSAHVDSTLAVWGAVRDRTPDVGICLQAYLHRTENDLERLLPRTPNIRLVKGAYREPSDIAMERKSQVDESFRRLTSRMLRERAAGRMGKVAVATHDRRLIADAGRVAFEIGLPSDAWEIEMLYGIATEEQRRLVSAETPLRVLISYGEHWFPWYMRRLAERPANVGFVLKQLVAR
ncbi:MAG: proline dehydrogenase family protein [Gemmatimonadetes bacterium]|nr:proline dehydrogenase family protein [Gemmatimonadota bacterium]